MAEEGVPYVLSVELEKIYSIFLSLGLLVVRARRHVRSSCSRWWRPVTEIRRFLRL